MDFCQGCGAEIPDWDAGYYARSMMCINCYNRKAEENKLRPCTMCGLRKRPDQLQRVRDRTLCEECAKEYNAEILRKECALCKHWIEDWEKKFQMPNGRFICEKCHNAGPGKAGSRVCARCGKTPVFPFFAPDGQVYCEACAPLLAHSPSSAQMPLLARVVNRIERGLDEHRAKP